MCGQFEDAAISTSKEIIHYYFIFYHMFVARYVLGKYCLKINTKQAYALE
jgi:hypothetical protein